MIDIFPAENAELALRISLFDDEIESLALLIRSPATSSNG